MPTFSDILESAVVAGLLAATLAAAIAIATKVGFLPPVVTL